MNSNYAVMADKAKNTAVATDSYRVSPRHLGQMRRAGFCPRCFSYSVDLGFRHPFDMPMPGIMFNMDRFEKILVDAHFKAKGAGPKWLASLGCTGPVDFPAKMTEEIPNLGLTLVGMPDAVFSKADGSLCLVDYKTAAFKGLEDPFMPIYETQLWGYARLLEHEGIGTVTTAALVYFANTLKDYSEKPLDLLTNDGIRVPFTVKIHEVAIDLNAIDPLLKAFRKYADLSQAPAGVDGCKNCQRLNRLFEVEQRQRGLPEMMDALKNRDRAFMFEQLQRRESMQRKQQAIESHGWENDLADGLLDYADCVPGACDI